MIKECYDIGSLMNKWIGRNDENSEEIISDLAFLNGCNIIIPLSKIPKKPNRYKKEIHFGGESSGFKVKIKRVDK